MDFFDSNLLRSSGSNTPSLATIILLKSYGDTPSACGGEIHCALLLITNTLGCGSNSKF